MQDNIKRIISFYILKNNSIIIILMSLNDTFTNKKHHKSLNLSAWEISKTPQHKPAVSKSKKKLSATQIKQSTERLMQPQKSIMLIDFDKVIEKKEQELNMKTEKMYALIDIFNLMQSNNFPIRCMEHNNTLTLYCFTQRKILCANCTYGAGKHKTHKIVPLKDSQKFIKEDNEQLVKILRQDLKTLDKSMKNSQQNRRVLEQRLKSSLAKIKEEYNKKFNELQQKYKKTITNTKQRFQDMINKSTNIEYKIEQFKIKIWQSLSKIGVGAHFEGIVNDTALIKQVITSRLSEVTRFQFQKMSGKQIQKLCNISQF